MYWQRLSKQISFTPSRIFTCAVGSPWMKGLSSFSGVKVLIGRSFGSNTWGSFNVNANIRQEEKSSSSSCQLEVHLVFCFSLVRGELQYQAMEKGQHLSTNDNNSEHFKVGSQKRFGREQRNAKLIGTQCVSI